MTRRTTFIVVLGVTVAASAVLCGAIWFVEMGHSQ